MNNAGDVLARSLPLSGPADIQVHKIRSRVVPDSADSEARGRFAELTGARISQTHVDGHALHVQAVGGYSTRSLPEHPVRYRRAIAGNHLEGCIAPYRSLDGIEQIEKSPVDGMDIAGSEVAQQVIDAGQGMVVVAARAVVGQRELLAGMQMIKGDLAGAGKVGPCRGRGYGQTGCSKTQPASSGECGSGRCHRFRSGGRFAMTMSVHAVLGR